MASLVGGLRRLSNRVLLLQKARSADAFLASYPKSGRTWFRYILANYLNISATLNVDVNLHTMFTVIPNFDMDPVRGIPAFQFHAVRPKVPLILVTHRSYQRLVFQRRPVIFMVRDVRDVAVSAYFHATRHKHRYTGEIGAFLRDPAQGVPAIIRYLNSWADNLHLHPHVIISYEMLSADPKGAATNALRFLGCDIHDDALNRAIQVSRFEAMQNREQLEGIPAHEYDRDDSESLRMRRGKAGGYHAYLSSDEVAYIDRFCLEHSTPAARKVLGATDVRMFNGLSEASG